jgi:formylglycine-generating enzyme required for sulfatase activity
MGVRLLRRNHDRHRIRGHADHRRLPGGVDPDLHAAESSAARSEHGDISRVRRGGCWADEGWPCRSAFRVRFEPERRHDHIGFRVVAVETGG